MWEMNKKQATRESGNYLAKTDKTVADRIIIFSVFLTDFLPQSKILKRVHMQEEE